MSNYDEVIEKNRQYLTQAQRDALVAASMEYNVQNAGKRAGALASAREQYDAGYRGLQNMGLAGSMSGTPTSGEVPRLQMQVRTPFDEYNRSLRDVENRRLNVLGGQFAQQTRVARAQAAEAARAAEEARLKAAAEVARIRTSNKAEQIYLQGQSDLEAGYNENNQEMKAKREAVSAINARGAAQTAYHFENGEGLSPAQKYQRDGMARTRAIAAAQATGLASAVNQAQTRGRQLTEKLNGSTDASGMYKYTAGPDEYGNVSVQEVSPATRQAESVLMTGKGFDTEADKSALKAAEDKYENLKWARHYGGKTSVSDEEFNSAKNAAEVARLKVDDPELYAAYYVSSTAPAGSEERIRAGEIIAARSMPHDDRTDEQYAEDNKKAKYYAAYLGTIDDPEATETEKQAARNMLGVPEEEAREFIENHKKSRSNQAKYNYYKKAIINEAAYAGAKPKKDVNEDETDQLYRAVNKLQKTNEDDPNLLYSELAALPEDITGSPEYIGNELRFLTDEERDVYNYLYETQGLANANQYIRDTLPLRYIRAAEDDEAYAKRLVDKNAFAANLLSIGANTIGNVPAMFNKLVKGTFNSVQDLWNGRSPLYIDTNDSMHQLANIGNTIQSTTSQKILESNPGTSGQVYNFIYQTGMSMAQSGVAMMFAYAGAPAMVDVLFFSSAGNEAYKDAIERGATQEQAMAYGVLSGAAEAIFEHASIEHFLNLDYQGRGQLVKNMLKQAGAEASEEVNTEIANILSDVLVMKDKSEYRKLVEQYGEAGAVTQLLKNVGMAGLGGLASGIGFGLFGAVPNAVSQVRTGKEAKQQGVVDNYIRNGNLLGGDAQRLAQEVSDAYGLKKDRSGAIETSKQAGREKLQTTEPGNRIVGALVQQVNKQAQELAKSAESGAAVQTLLTGEKLTTNGAKAVMDQLGADAIEDLGLDASSPSAFAKSYNERLQQYNVEPRLASTYRQAMYGMYDRKYGRPNITGTNAALEEQHEKNKQHSYVAAKADASNRVWANPTQGLAMATPEGNIVTPLPGNMTAVALAEQERSGFKARSTATKGNVTYSVAGMEARPGLSNEHVYSEIQKGLTKEARQKAQVYEKLADALGVKMIIHDVMTGTNGFIDENGNMHVVLSGKQSVLRVAAHELTHYMKGNAKLEYAGMRSHLISEVGVEKFDRMIKQKAKEYGIDLSTENGKILADDEVCAELCERMLSNEEALEKFAEKETTAAKTLKQHLLKILNAIKAAFKRADNRNFGESWSDLIKSQDTIESWITGLQKAIDNAEKREATTEGAIAKTAGVTTVDQAQMDEEMRSELFLDEDSTSRLVLNDEAEKNAVKGTSVPGITKKEMEPILSAAMYGTRDNYSADDYKYARSMIAQLVPDVIAGLNGEIDSDVMQKRMETAVEKMLDSYYEDEGDHTTLREVVSPVIGIDDTAKSEAKYDQETLFQLSSKLGKALGRKTTLVGKTNPQFKTAKKLEEVWSEAEQKFGLSDYQRFAQEPKKLIDFVVSQTASTRRAFDDLHKSDRANIVKDQVSKLVYAVDQMLAERVDKIMAEHSVDVIEYDMAGYAQDLFKAGMTQNDITVLFDTMNKAVDMVKAHRAILDYGAELNTEEDILKAKRERAYLPYKQNADPHYKLALDFSTLCRKRVLLQTIQERLQAQMGRALTQEETVAIRLELQKLQREGYKVEVACALCYVEAARLKSPKVINTFLNNTGAEMRNYFAKKNPASKQIIEGLQQKWKVERGLAPDATKEDMKAAGVNVTDYNNYSREKREQFESNNAAEKVTIDRAVRLANNEKVMIGGIEFPGRETFLSASWLTKLKSVEPDIFNAFTDKVRSATRSKAQETDTFYSRGDIDMVTESILNYANAESGFRHQSWSDFVPTHLLDTMAAVIEMSTRNAKMHAYTKVPSMVRLLGKTGMALNMSLIPAGDTGLVNGELSFDSVEGMPWEVMMELRDMFPDTAGNIAIGINDAQIQKLLSSKDIDYVIPYHASGMNKNMRGYMDIRAWSEYTSSQNEKTNHRGTKGAAPELKEWFDEKAAAKAKDGYAFMRAASEKYLQLCYDRNLTPKFSQYLKNNGDGSYSLKEGYEDYWKMLTDRKMVNQQTGKVIIQEAVKPIFDQDTALGILEDRLADPSIQDATKAADIVTEKFSGWQANRNNADAEAIQEAKNIRDRTVAITAQKTADAGGVNFSLDTDAIRQAFTVIDTAGIEDGLEALKDVKHVGSFALKDISRFLDASAGKNKDLRNTLHAIFEAPHSEATGRYARGVERMQQKVLDIGQRAGVCDANGNHFDSKKSAAIQNIGEGFSNTYTNLRAKVNNAFSITVEAYEPGANDVVVKERTYSLNQLREAYGSNVADYVWDQVYRQAEDARATGKQVDWVEQMVNTRPYTIDDLKKAFPDDWQKLKGAADEFRQMYDEYIRDQNNMLATIYPIESKYDSIEKLSADIEKKQQRLEHHKAAVKTQIENLQKSLEAKEKEIASKKRTDTKTYRQLVEQANKLTDKIAEVKADIAEYEASVRDELVKMSTLKAAMQNDQALGDESLKRMHRLQYRSDYFHHFTEMASGIQNLKSIFTNNTDIAPAIVGKSEGTRAKTKWAGYFQQRMGGDYTADALNGMLRYGQLAEYKLAFDPLTAYLRDVNKQIRNMSSDTNRDGLIRYIDQWADNIAGKSHKLDRVVSDSGMAPRKAMQILQWINSRVIQNTLLFNMRSALVQISNITNAKGIVKNNIDWANGLKAWAMAARGDEAMASIMAQSNFLASRYMDGLALTDSKLKSAKQFAGWMLGALDEISAKATWWAAYQQYTRNPNAAKNQYRNYDSAIDYADDITRRTHAGRGVGELAPAMTSKVVNFVAPFQVEVNNTWQLLKDNVKQKNYLGLLSTGLSVFLFNAAFEAIVGSTPLGFDFIRAFMDIVLGFTNDDKDDDPTAKSIAQRFAGELVGGLPFASQLVAAFGEDNAKKLLGEDNDATRYGNTQIGVNAVVNAVKGLKDIGSGLIEGRRVNWIDDLDDLMNLTMPYGAKQLTRSAQGLITATKGYAGKYDKEGNEKIQFVTDGDILDYIHAGLFGKWALTEASEYFGEKRLLPQLFGKYEGQKTSIGKPVDAKEYKAALSTGISGKDYFTLKDDLNAYKTQGGKRAELMQQKNLTPNQKAKLDALMVVDNKKESKTSGSVVYQKNSGGEWDVKADYSSIDWMDIAELGTKRYNQAKAVTDKGIEPSQFLKIYTAWEEMSGAGKKDQAKAYLDSLNLSKEVYDYFWGVVFNYKSK